MNKTENEGAGGASRSDTELADSRDAERYRWLRDNSGDCCDACGVFVDFPRVDCHRAPNKADIDYAIDLVMSQAPNGTKLSEGE